MPQDSKQSGLNARSSTASPGSTGAGVTSEAASTPLPHRTASPSIMWSAGIAVVLICAGAIFWARTAASRAWMRYAAEISGEFGPRNRFSPRYVSGSLADKPIFMETATNNDDDAPYYHTRASMPVSNPGQLIFGLRRKSMLEEAQTRNEKAAFESGDTDFDRRFHLVTNDAGPLQLLLDQNLRKLLLQYSDIEVYIGVNVVEWRRAGEVSDIRAIRLLNAALVRVATTVEDLPKRAIPLSQRLADEELIRKGI